MDRLRAEAQVGDGLRAGLVRVVDKITLGIQVSVFTDDLHAVLVRAHCAIGAQAVEHRAGDVGFLDAEGRIPRQAQVGDVIVDTNGETVQRLRIKQGVIDGLDHRRGEVFVGNAVATADHQRQALPLTTGKRVGEAGDYVQIQRLAGGARLLGLFQYCDALHRNRQRSEQVLG